ncbi:MurR/RpiR family transcriptional regulator [Rossellomorea aquimaris]|jgi:RpiR family transcriptional regulator, carbohydrate utilization regulator|uniref:MurR/RpiR family transcriptional regulator n=1 Tax=Rossellomorea aquimaris TaxID=189382 RepID=A0A5D4TZ28_9BACI|nr:MurR/RpiR family transcriptional regulator [Rossellomorea aquimaris]TYS80263.1 MurR/RpiR family transcriptional regulator [Rossellomorea aquimaris]TYS85647.1 MurR/RpiR family transcriptional regulator [Rossellomorea aquimaris]
MKVEKVQHCLPRIRSYYSQFSEKEKMIADFIIANPEKIIHSTISGVAEELNVADATVFRFCKRLGFKGYQAMKISLASDLVTPIKDIHETINEEDSEGVIAQKVFRSNIRTLEDSLSMLNEEMFTKAIRGMISARKIEFYGTGGSGFVAMDAHHKFLRTGMTTTAYNDSHMQLISASQLTDADVIVFISHSGSNKDLLEVLDVAKKNRVTTIAITHFAKSPLSIRVDIPLFTVSQETEYRSEALASRISQLSIVDALYVNTMMKRKDLSKSSLQKMRDAISIKKI